MNLRSFLDNPVGKGDASINNKLIMGVLSQKYDNLINKKDKKIEMTVFKNAASDTYWFWFIITTETNRTNTYDVVIKLSDKDGSHKKDLSVSNYDAQFFANTPSFAYTYAYVYNKNGIMIPELSKKLGGSFIADSPNVRNRQEVIMYDKYIYFATRYLLDSKQMNRARLEVIARPFNEKYLFSKIRTLDTIMDEYKEAERKLKAKERGTTKSPRNEKVSSTSNTNSIHKVSTFAPIQKTQKLAGRSSINSVSKKKGTIKKRK